MKKGNEYLFCLKLFQMKAYKGKRLVLFRVPSKCLNRAPVNQYESDEEAKKWTVSNYFELAQIFVAVAGIILIVIELNNNEQLLNETRKQLELNNNTNKVSYRGQLYEEEENYNRDALNHDVLNTLWISVPTTLKELEYCQAVLSSVTKNQKTINSKNVEELTENLFGYKTFQDPILRKETENLRKVYMYAQAYLYHVHNAFDYRRDSILLSGEFDTWKGFIQEIGPNPIFLAVIANGHNNHYFSKEFAKLLQDELYPIELTGNMERRNIIARNKKVIEIYYKPMTEKIWPERMPTY